MLPLIHNPPVCGIEVTKYINLQYIHPYNNEQTVNISPLIIRPGITEKGTGII